jgi:GNAT superfamily N-acetyltransferase
MMERLLVRKGVRPDIEVVKNFDHSIKTNRVWQMQQNLNNGEIATRFLETQLPREMRVLYPRSPESLENFWGDFSAVLVGCIDQAPVGYLTLNSYFAPEIAWVKDIVVDEIWREKGIASSLIEKAIGWAKERQLPRLMMEVSSKNFPAISLARKHKFDYSGFNDSFFGNRDIALFFTRDLTSRISG